MKRVFDDNRVLLNINEHGILDKNCVELQKPV